MKRSEFENFINSTDIFEELYGSDPKIIEMQKSRYRMVVEAFFKRSPQKSEFDLFSVSGRCELGGNHTDHNGGRVMAGAVDCDIIAAACKMEEKIYFGSVQSAVETVTVDRFDVRPHERYTSRGLLRGVCSGLVKNGYRYGGFFMTTHSTIPSGSGLSSSAAFEVLGALIESWYYNNGEVSPIELAQVGQYAENVYFGKPCGLMDQAVCAEGGICGMDFVSSPPYVEKLNIDFVEKGYALCLVNTKSSHADLTTNYRAITDEMERVAAYFGKKRLRDVDINSFVRDIGRARRESSDRAVLRATHFFYENERVKKQTQALKSGDFQRFLDLVNESGESSALLLQNIYNERTPHMQPLMLAITVGKLALNGRGAVRVHGGGFAGTVIAVVPVDMVETFKAAEEAVFRAGCCQVLRIRPCGAVKLA